MYGVIRKSCQGLSCSKPQSHSESQQKTQISHLKCRTHCYILCRHLWKDNFMVKLEMIDSSFPVRHHIYPSHKPDLHPTYRLIPVLPYRLAHKIKYGLCTELRLKF